ncbi:unnamed protein product [Paramecium sonneborni]|nr:unnamed protein product [Paramecium sonneborni]
MISQGNNQEVMLQFNQKQNNRKYWSNDEHKKLNSAVILHGSNWKIVAEYLPGRNASQCEQRWKRIKPKENERNYTQQNWEINQGEICQSLDQNIRKTPWTEDEDKWVLNYWYQMVCYVQKVARKTCFHKFFDKFRKT